MTHPIILPAGEGEHIRFLANVETVKADREATGRWAVVEITAPAGYEPPMHVHEEEDEAFYILDGELTITIGDQKHTAGAGAFVLSPQGVPHTIRAERDSRWLQFSPSGRFVDLMRDVGEPAESPTLPKLDGALDFTKLTERAAKHGIRMPGPG